MPASSAAPNAIARTFGIFNDEWSLLLLRASIGGATKYSDFQARMPISHATLSNRLARLVEDGFFLKAQYQEHPVRHEYTLTAQGRAVWPILVAIWGWERRWVDTHSYETPPIVHTLCRTHIDPLYCCQHCAVEAEVHNIRAHWGPTGGWARSIPAGTTRRRSSSKAGSLSFYPETMRVIGNRWSASIVGTLFFGARRFTHLQEILGTPPTILSQRLLSLTNAQIIEPLAHPDSASGGYQLTTKGNDLFPIIHLMVEWTERWQPTPAGRALLFVHLECGQTFRGHLVCNTCSAPLHAKDLRLGTLQDD